MIKALALAAGLVAFSLGSATAGPEPKAVVELFTSQGCSSCPPADAFIGELAKREDVLPLSFHVGYWDYLGWKDTFGLADSGERQRAYAAVQGDRWVFTPEVIVNGTNHFVGGNKAGVIGAVASASLPVPVSVNYHDETLIIQVGSDQPAPPRKTTVRLVTFISKAEVAIQKGENTGSTITYHNVVRSIRPIGMWRGAPLAITLPADEVLENGEDGCAVLVQEDLPDGPGSILGASFAYDTDRRPQP